ncbi:MAG: hypothetical protein QXU74_00685 [Candidatus Aenigmatarchaeota archaeon]
MQKINVTYEQLKKYMDKNSLKSQDRLIKRVKRILDKYGITSIQRVAYLDYAKELHKKWWNFKGETLNKEVKLVFLKWNERVLNKDVLLKIIKLLNLRIIK